MGKTPKVKNPLDGKTMGKDSSSITKKQGGDTSPQFVGALPRKTHNIDAASENWNQAYPYLFYVVEDKGNGNYERASFSKVNRGLQNLFGSSYGDVYALNMPPSAISHNVVFANNVTATNNGVLEENAGVVFRQISISGTTGLFPERNTKGAAQSAASSFAKSILTDAFSGTLSAVDKVKNSFNKLKNRVSGTAASDKTQKIAGKDQLRTTGFYKFWEFNNFLINYAEAKKEKGSENLRLVFYSVKDGVGYVFTTRGFSMSRDAGNPLLYNYSMSMTAYDIWVSDPKVSPIQYNLPQLSRPNTILEVLNLIRDTRAAINDASNVVSSVVSDLSQIMNVYTQAVMVLADLGRIGVQVFDVLEILKTNKEVLIDGANNQLLNSIKDFSSSASAAFGFGSFQSVTSVDEKTSKFPSKAIADTVSGAGGSPSPNKKTIGGETKITAASSQKILGLDLLDKAFEDSSFGQIDIEELDLPTDVLNQIEDKVNDVVFNTTSNDVRSLANNLKTINDNLSLEFGEMDETYAEVFDIDIIDPERGQNRQIGEDEIILMAKIEESRTGFISSLATGELFKESGPDPFEIANENLKDEDSLKTPSSAFVVPYRRGATLNSMAQEYLGDATRAREIALLNGLRAPFIDEEGFTISIFNANGRSFVIKNEDRVVIGQFVKISGTGVSVTRRQVINIIDIGNNEKQIIVDGPNNLDDYLPATNPTLNARIPGTIGSGDFLLIPSVEEPIESIATRETALWSRIKAAEKVFRVDLKLDEKYARDFVVTSNNDIDRVFGYDNAVQAIRLMVETEQGELEAHPEYGLAVPLGQRNSDVDFSEITAAIQGRIQSDPRFLDVDASIDVEGSVARVKVLARGAGGTGLIPLNFESGRVE